MTYKEAIDMLQQFNEWRRGAETEQIDPFIIGQAIDVAIEAMKTHPAPDWSDAPEWAEWWAIDPDGEEWRYEKEPVLMGSAAHSPMGGRAEFIGKRFKMKQRRPGKE